MMNYYIMRVTIMFCLHSLATTSPPSQEDNGFCSQVYLMHQCCTSQMSPNLTGVTHKAAIQPRVGKAGPVGPQGPPGIVNYTAIGENIEKKYLDLEARINERFERLGGVVEARLERSDTQIVEIKNETAKNSRSIEENRKRTYGWSSCNDVPRSDHESWEGKGGLFHIFREGRFYEVYCDMTTDGGGWTVFQRRIDGSVDFYRTWEEYVDGFGNKSSEFWLGLENIHQLTQGGDYELRIDLTDWDRSTAKAKYGTFSITGRSDNYRLRVGEYSGTAGDSLTYHNNRPFSAKNKDLDGWSEGSCATTRRAAWWFVGCGYSNLNGRYNDTSGNDRGVFWQSWKQLWQYSLKASEMKFRKK